MCVELSPAITKATPQLSTTTFPAGTVVLGRGGLTACKHVATDRLPVLVSLVWLRGSSTLNVYKKGPRAVNARPYPQHGRLRLKGFSGITGLM